VRLDWAIPCRYAEATWDGTATLVGAGVDSIWASSLPRQATVFLMLRFAGAEDEFEDETSFEVRVVDPAAREQLAAAASLPHATLPLRLPGIEIGVLVTREIDWDATEYGLYTLEVYLSNRRLRSVPVAVRPASELEQLDE
jgi:hypothetical protein